MPYVREHDRKVLDDEILKLLARLRRLGHDGMEGRLNYVITMLLTGTMPAGFGYKHINRAIGILGCVQQEFYRRLVAPYEDKKIEENGDLLPFEKVEDTNG